MLWMAYVYLETVGRNLLLGRKFNLEIAETIFSKLFVVINLP